MRNVALQKDGCSTVLPKRRYPTTRIHGATTQETTNSTLKKLTNYAMQTAIGVGFSI
jgi:hypothetical protein